ncbi:class I SAM-dependent methyltransferase [Peribacillus cavernae]|uniref:Class I SAM-dependent methyltransferase n=1 Tax=Peribacillus cavernae TaxID=1674310 RepID=A0A433HGY1_9BACI|nr:class I SAM-dependent methyltransferase [Peribacillus cavernae]MDQ0221074.1 site-specific DNA-methyltransferase (adenine-specific) [Peribacillus cavernae]RUQ27631.1 class I SAM-dependent methyltransferase [Peribacillus cavernae]
MNFTPIEELFHKFDETALILQEELACTYLDALGETGENFFHGNVVQEEVSELSRKRLSRQYHEFSLEKYSKEDIRKAFQLAILKGMKENIQPNHQMTPDAVGMFVSYLIGKFTNNNYELSMIDPAAGTGNLLFTILNHLSDKRISAYGVDIDETLIRLSYSGANLQEHSVQFFNQDSLEPLFIDPADIAVSDLPVGYYPNDVRAADYELAADEGHSFSHHLFIEQSITHVKPGGYLFFIIPNGLFLSEEASKLNDYLKKTTHIQGMVQLPLSMFKSEAAAKSILILQKTKEGVTPPKNALLVDLPKLSDRRATESVMNKIDAWFKEEK